MHCKIVHCKLYTIFLYKRPSVCLPTAFPIQYSNILSLCLHISITSKKIAIIIFVICKLYFHVILLLPTDCALCSCHCLSQECKVARPRDHTPFFGKSYSAEAVIRGIQDGGRSEEMNCVTTSEFAGNMMKWCSDGRGENEEIWHISTRKHIFCKENWLFNLQNRLQMLGLCEIATFAKQKNNVP